MDDLNDVTALLGLIVAGAAWLAVHVRLLVRVVRAPRPGRVRWLALLPPAAPFIGWLCGARFLAGAWFGCGLLYAWLRSILPA